jgi:RsiW-degrading membrane proteinase PrsW (M82 family)
MEKIVLISFLVTLLFCGFKFVEIKYLDKEDKPLKTVVRDAIVVFICSLVATFVFFNLEGHINDFFNVVTDTKVLNAGNTQVFTDAPGF